MDQDFSLQRQQMVRDHIMRRGISDEGVLAAMLEVPRHLFLPSTVISFAYQDTSLPIGDGQTISQPYIVALMVQVAELDKTSKVLEIGTGSGYGAAILSRVAGEVHTIERIPTLAANAKAQLQSLGYNNIHVHTGDGTLGLSAYEPYDAILVTAAANEIPASYLSQLKKGGRLIIPVGDAMSQQLVRLRKIDSDYSKEFIELVRFVPLIPND
jgi:protein-L-isoaspartate(D-aspartate) O-methyltransferase